MQVVLRTAALCAMVAGCTGGTGAKSGDTSGGGDTSSDTSSSHDYAADLPDLSQDLDQTGCEDWQGNEIPGATTYFYGVFSQVDGGWSGEEMWLLYANDTWAAAGEGDCQLLWAAEATDATPGDTACSSCDVALDVTFTLDVTQTTCPEDLYKTEMSGTESYAVKYTSDTESTWYFAGDGVQFGVGAYNTGAMNYLTSKACKWF